MRRRIRTQPSSLTSLLDVLFIVAFASLAQASARVEIAEAPQAQEPEKLEEPERPEKPAPAPRPRQVAESKIYARALVELTEANEDRAALLVRISAAGTVQSVSEKGVDASVQALDIPLLAADPNPDVALVYRGRDNPENRVCRLVREALGGASLEGMLVVMAPAVPLSALPVALVSGLRKEPSWCLRDERAFAVVVDPALVTDSASGAGIEAGPGSEDNSVGQEQKP